MSSLCFNARETLRKEVQSSCNAQNSCLAAASLSSSPNVNQTQACSWADIKSPVMPHCSRIYIKASWEVRTQTSSIWRSLRKKRMILLFHPFVSRPSSSATDDVPHMDSALYEVCNHTAAKLEIPWPAAQGAG